MSEIKQKQIGTVEPIPAGTNDTMNWINGAISKYGHKPEYEQDLERYIRDLLSSRTEKRKPFMKINRSVGNTTKMIDYFIDVLFTNYKDNWILVRDHYKSQHADEIIVRKIKDRLYNEHKLVLDTKYENGKNFIRIKELPECVKLISEYNSIFESLQDSFKNYIEQRRGYENITFNKMCIAFLNKQIGDIWDEEYEELIKHQFIEELNRLYDLQYKLLNDYPGTIL